MFCEGKKKGYIKFLKGIIRTKSLKEKKEIIFYVYIHKRTSRVFFPPSLNFLLSLVEFFHFYHFPFRYPYLGILHDVLYFKK